MFPDTLKFYALPFTRHQQECPVEKKRLETYPSFASLFSFLTHPS